MHLALGAGQIRSHAGLYQGGREVLLILAVSESEAAELPRFSSACGAGPQPPKLAGPGWQYALSQGLGTASGGQLQGGLGSQATQPSAEPPRAKPQARLRAKLSPFNLHTRPEVAEDR